MNAIISQPSIILLLPVSSCTRIFVGQILFSEINCISLNHSCLEFGVEIIFVSLRYSLRYSLISYFPNRIKLQIGRFDFSGRSEN